MGMPTPGVRMHASGARIKWVLTEWLLSFRLLRALLYPDVVFLFKEATVSEKEHRRWADTTWDPYSRVLPWHWRDASVGKITCCASIRVWVWTTWTRVKARRQEILRECFPSLWKRQGGVRMFIFLKTEAQTKQNKPTNKQKNTLVFSQQ